MCMSDNDNGPFFLFKKEDRAIDDSLLMFQIRDVDGNISSQKWKAATKVLQSYFSNDEWYKITSWTQGVVKL
ncbi:MAG: hypothetical protein V4591_06490, partial [Bdellovibrionota bacterium]